MDWEGRRYKLSLLVDGDSEAVSGIQFTTSCEMQRVVIYGAQGRVEGYHHFQIVVLDEDTELEWPIFDTRQSAIKDGERVIIEAHLPLTNR